jgi:hypothetical protein
VLLEVGRWLWANTLGLIDPFWGYLLEGLIIIAVAVLVSWFFSVLRPFGGALVMAVIAFLVGFWKGEDRG